MSWHVWLLGAAATVRLTRFVNLDLLFEPVRAWVERTAGPDSKIAYLLSCPWCASVWIAAVVMPLAYLSAGGTYTAFEVLASIAAASYIAAMADRFLEPAE